MTYARLRDVLGMLERGDLHQEAVVLVDGKLVPIDYIDSFRGNKDLASKFGGQPHQVFLTNNKEL
jgi:hypothetical protein